MFVQHVFNVQCMLVCMHLAPFIHAHANNQLIINNLKCAIMCDCICCVHACASYMCCFNMSWFVSNTNGTKLCGKSTKMCCCNTLAQPHMHTLSMQHALSMQLHGQLNTTDSCKLPFRIILRLITTDIPHLPHLAILTNLMLHMF